MDRKRCLVSLLLAVGLALVIAPGASAKTVWLCKPGLANNPCLSSLTTTVVAADGSTTTQRPTPARRPAIDCFYVYPTVSGQSGANATKAKEPGILDTARAQASRFSSVCRVFAPVYRQLTIAAILKPSLVTPATIQTAYGDVVSAWREYLRKDNRGRGVVLISHSQGTLMLRRLAREEIDPRPKLRRLLVSALLLGGNVTVKKGRDRGGDFKHIGACRKRGEIGCVVAYSSFLGAPPQGTLFGKPHGFFFGANDKPGVEVLCTNPATLSGDRGALFSSFPTWRIRGPLGSDTPPPPAAPTPWVGVPGLYRARCASNSFAHWLQIDDVGGPSDTRRRVTETLGAAWGLHLVDVNIADGNLLGIVRRQASAFVRARR